MHAGCHVVPLDQTVWAGSHCFHIMFSSQLVPAHLHWKHVGVISAPKAQRLPWRQEELKMTSLLTLSCSSAGAFSKTPTVHSMFVTLTACIKVEVLKSSSRQSTCCESQLFGSKLILFGHKKCWINKRSAMIFTGSNDVILQDFGLRLNGVEGKTT